MGKEILRNIVPTRQEDKAQDKLNIDMVGTLLSCLDWKCTVYTGDKALRQVDVVYVLYVRNKLSVCTKPSILKHKISYKQKQHNTQTNKIKPHQQQKQTKLIKGNFTQT